ncbi:hypothetical protein [Oricola thermophila]|uniref:Uncharacterized protein n=1 Tax=Oricola thermophila TaxID=2742145 RepID=A0A6N1V9F3_9HYPH|nr:hypothetical protein [Oricola thermophila]QKV17358.1 hypothetical protein HTY61_02195 [Oricola thermophila]
MRILSLLVSKGLLIILGLSAAITLLAPSIVSVAMITIIGIPLGIYLALAPTLFLVALGAWIFGRLFGGGFLVRAGGAIVALALLAVPPLLANARLDAAARQLAMDDHDDLARTEARVIAFRFGRLGASKPQPLRCDGLCQRLLLNGVADRVLYIREDVSNPPAPGTVAAAYRMERRGTCPDIELPRNDPVKLDGERRNRDGKNVAELMNIRIAAGTCLVAEEAPLGEAGLVVSSGAIKRGMSDISAGLDIFADTVSAGRLTLHERDGAAFRETFRETSVAYRRLWHLYMPSVVGGAELRMYPGLVRRKEQSGGENASSENIGGFLAERLGWDLALRQDDADEAMRRLLVEALDDDRAEVPSALAADFFVRIRKSRTMSPADRVLSRRILADRRFAVPEAAFAAVLYAGDAPKTHFSAIAATAFERLRDLSAVEPGANARGWLQQVRSLGIVVSRLPRETILSRRGDLEWLAREERLRVPAYAALTRLSEFGAEGADTLLWLIDDAWRFRGKGPNAWQHPYLAGVIGLCRAGTAAGDAVGPFIDRMASGRIVQHGSYWDLNINTLFALGAGMEDIRAAVEFGESGRTAKRFEREIDRARRKGPDCTY